jgi:AGZA family xanthine/uracil permease-like MFS transporter
VLEVVSRGRIVGPDKEFKEPWTWKVKGGLLPAWVVRAGRGKKDFWHEDQIPDEVEQSESACTGGLSGVKVPSRSDAEAKSEDEENGARKLDGGDLDEY